MVNEVNEIISKELISNVLNMFCSFMNNEDNIKYFIKNIDIENMSDDCKNIVNKIEETCNTARLKKELLELIDYNCNKFNSIIDDELYWIYTKDDLNYLDMSIVELLENIDINNFDIYDDCFTFDSKYGLLISMKYNDYVEYIDTYVDNMNCEELQTAIKKLKHITTI